MPKVYMPRIRGFRMEVLSWKTCEWTVAYERVGQALEPTVYKAVLEAAIKDPEVLEVRVLKTHDSPQNFSDYLGEEETTVPPLPEPVVVQHVKLHWRRGRT